MQGTSSASEETKDFELKMASKYGLPVIDPLLAEATEFATEFVKAVVRQVVEEEEIQSVLEDLIEVEKHLVSNTLADANDDDDSDDTKGNGKVSTSSSAAAASGIGTAAEAADEYKYHSSFEGHEGQPW